MLDNILGYHHHTAEDTTSPSPGTSPGPGPLSTSPGASAGAASTSDASPSPSPGAGANRASPVADAWLSVQRVVLNDPTIQVTPLETDRYYMYPTNSIMCDIHVVSSMPVYLVIRYYSSYSTLC